MCYPEFLYHYTTIDSLELILKNRTFRFRSLKDMDDLEECKTANNTEYAKYLFVSSWTENSQETIPLWDRYVGDKSGVLLSLPSLPFQEYPFDPNIRFLLPPVKIYSHFQNDGFAFMTFSQECGFLHKVEYTDEEDKLFPDVGGNTEIHYDSDNKVGIYKSKCWDYQQEYRYILKIYPVGDSTSNATLVQPSLDQHNLPIDHYDLRIRDEAFSQMQIWLDPYTLERSHEEQRVKELLNKYNRPALGQLRFSSLQGKFRRKS